MIHRTAGLAAWLLLFAVIWQVERLEAHRAGFVFINLVPPCCSLPPVVTIL